MFLLDKGAKIILLGKNQAAVTAYFKLRGTFDIIGFMDNDATEETVFCSKPCFMLNKINRLDGAVVIIYSEKCISICKWLNQHGYQILKDFIPYFMFDYDSIDFHRISLVTPEEQIASVLKRMRKNKKAALIHGNCQTIPLKIYLRHNKRFTQKYIIYDIPPLHLINKQNESIFCSKSLFEDISLFITQLVSENNRFGYHLSTKYFLDNLSLNKTCKYVVISNLWFDGYFPQHLNKLSNELIDAIPAAFLWQDKNLDFFAKEGRSMDEILSLVTRKHYYSQQFLDDLFEKNFISLAQREESVDIKMADYLRQVCKQDIQFYSVNHPKNIIIKELAKRLLAFIGLYQKEEMISFDHEYLIDQNETLKITCEAVYPAVYQYLGLQDKEPKYSFNYPGSIRSREYLLFEDYVKDYLIYNYSYAYEEKGD